MVHSSELLNILFSSDQNRSLVGIHVARTIVTTSLALQLWLLHCTLLYKRTKPSGASVEHYADPSCRDVMLIRLDKQEAMEVLGRHMHSREWMQGLNSEKIQGFVTSIKFWCPEIRGFVECFLQSSSKLLLHLASPATKKEVDHLDRSVGIWR